MRVIREQTDKKVLTESTNDYALKAYITNLGRYNEGDLVGEWVKFPIDEDDFEEVLKRIGIGSNDEFGQPYEEWFVTDYDSDIDVSSILGEYPQYDEIQEVAEKLEDVYDDMDVFNGILELTGDFDEAYNVYTNGDYSFYEGVQDNDDLGRAVVDMYGSISELSKETLENYFDYEAYGRDIDIESTGTFTENGYIQIF